MSLAWYVARTKPLVEYRARDYLEEKGIQCFLPSVRTPSPRQWREDAPLFPGYLFVRYDLQEWDTNPLRWGQGLAGLVAFEGFVPAVPDESIEELSQRVTELNCNGGMWRRFRSGDQVLVQVGPQGTETLAQVVAEGSPHGRVRVLLEFLGRLCQADVPWASLRPAWEKDSSGAAVNWQPRRRTRGRGRYLRGVTPHPPNNGQSST